MASIAWLGRAAAIAQVDTITIAGVWATGDTLVVTIGGAVLTMTAGAAVATTDIAAALKAMLAGDSLVGSESRTATGKSVPQFAELTATVSGSVVTVTGPAGKPFTMTSTETTAGTGTAARAGVTTATGPNDVSNTVNWDGGVLPGAGDTIYLRNSTVSLLYNLTSITGTLAALVIDASFTGFVGLSDTNSAGYPEYRTKDLTIDVSSVVIGIGTGAGASRIRLNTGTVQTAVQVYKLNGGQNGGPALFLRGSHAANTLEVHSGSVGVAIYGGETAQYATVLGTGGTIRFGGGATLSGATFTVAGATVQVETNTLTVTMQAGQFTILGTATLGTLTATGGTLIYLSSGTITTATCGGGKDETIVDARGDASAKTITTLNFKPRFVLRHIGNVTVTTPVFNADCRELRAA